MSVRLLPPLMLACLLSTGCGWDGPWLQTWWGDLEGEGGGPANFDAGTASALTAVSYDITTPDGTALQGWVLTGSWVPASCTVHRAHFRALESLLTEAEGIALDANGAAWICDRLGGLAREAYGDDGGHRAIHSLVRLPETGGTVRPAPMDLRTDEAGAFDSESTPIPGTFVGRILEWGTAQLPGDEEESGSRCTDAVSAAWAEEGAGFHDGIRAGAFRIYGHRFAGEEQVAREDGDGAPVGFVAQGEGEDRELTAKVFTDAPDIMGSTYPQMIAGTLDEPVPMEDCPEAANHAAWAFPELFTTPVSP